MAGIGVVMSSGENTSSTKCSYSMNIGEIWPCQSEPAHNNEEARPTPFTLPITSQQTPSSCCRASACVAHGECRYYRFVWIKSHRLR